jgi:hypothetical protein
MIRVTVELVPHGVEAQKKTIAVAELVKVGHILERDDEYNYRAFITLEDGQKFQTTFVHDRSQGFLTFVFRAFWSLARDVKLPKFK